jgi:hypothetical protein
MSFNGGVVVVEVLEPAVVWSLFAEEEEEEVSVWLLQRMPLQLLNHVLSAQPYWQRSPDNE